MRIKKLKGFKPIKIPKKISKTEMTLTVLFSIGIAILLFVALPYFATLFIGFEEETQPFFFNLIDGIIRIGVFFVVYCCYFTLKRCKNFVPVSWSRTHVNPLL